MPKLTVLSVKNATTPKMYADGDGLYLRVQKGKDPANPSKTWVYRWGAGGRNQMSLGPVRDCSLSEARERVAEARKQVRANRDPREELRKKRAAASSAANTPTFQSVALEYIAIHEVSWVNVKHRQQWRNTLATYAYPKIGSLRCDQITTEHVQSVLAPIWAEKNETASRLRGRIVKIWDMAKAKGLCQGENPARRQGALDTMLPRIVRRQRIEHYEAMPYADVPAFAEAIKDDSSRSAKALIFCILTATRTSETIKAEWSEFELENKLWTVPAKRMKMKKQHRVPLADQVIDLLKELKESDRDVYVFANPLKRLRGIEKHLSNMAMLTYLQRRPEFEALTVHGFRSSFSDWVAEKTKHDADAREYALAHVKKDQTEGAYQRGDLLEKRRPLMQDWADYFFSSCKIST